MNVLETVWVWWQEVQQACCSHGPQICTCCLDLVITYVDKGLPDYGTLWWSSWWPLPEMSAVSGCSWVPRHPRSLHLFTVRVTFQVHTGGSGWSLGPAPSGWGPCVASSGHLSAHHVMFQTRWPSWSCWRECWVIEASMHNACLGPRGVLGLRMSTQVTATVCELPYHTTAFHASLHPLMQGADTILSEPCSIFWHLLIVPRVSLYRWSPLEWTWERTDRPDDSLQFLCA